MKRTLSMLLTVLMVFSIGQGSYAKSELPRILLNGEEIVFAHAPYVENGTTMVPVRELAEKWGYKVTYSPVVTTLNSFSTKPATVELSKTQEVVLRFDQNSSTAWERPRDMGDVAVDSGTREMPTASVVKNGTFFVPLRFLCEKLGAEITYDERSHTITISHKETITEDTFAVKLNKKMPQDKNYMFSPLSIKMALAMAANGADGQTKDEILKTCGIDNLDEYNAYAKKLMTSYEKSSNVTLNIANSIWVNQDRMFKGLRLSETYQNTIQKQYDGQANSVTDENAVPIINKWISDKTNGKIQNMLSNSQFWVALVNAVYFKGTWDDAFSTQSTRPSTFTDKNNEKKETLFMHDLRNVHYTDANNVPMIELPYKGNQFSMYVALTDDPTFDFESQIKNMAYETVSIAMPKFKTVYDTSLKDTLKDMGMAKAFDKNNAEFAPMIEPSMNLLYISDVLHKTYVDVDENGTEAAAVTAIVVDSGSAATVSYKPFTADHPFTYFIYDNVNKEILFMGQYGFAE